MLVQYGRSAVAQGPAYLPGRASAFWTFAHKHVKGSMIDGYAAELGLSSDARKAYPKVIGTYRQIAALHTRPPTSSEVASACGVTKGLVDQILNVLYRPWLALDDIAEHAPGAIPPPAAPPSAYNSTPDTVVAAQDELDQRRALVQTLCARCLGAEEAARFLVLQILREGSGGYDCGWDEIAAALCGTASPPSPDWESTVESEFAAWTCLPTTWPAVRELFLRQHPAPTSVYLRQRFSQARRAGPGFSALAQRGRGVTAVQHNLLQSPCEDPAALETMRQLTEVPLVQRDKHSAVAEHRGPGAPGPAFTALYLDPSGCRAPLHPVC